MDKIVIEGGCRLKGSLRVSGAKNAVLPILAACLLTDEQSVIENVPAVVDTYTMLKILKALSVKVDFDGDTVVVKPGNYKRYTAPYRLVSTMRASICVLGPLLARLGKACVSMPGGCVIGPRPIDLHLKGLSALGAKIKIEHGYVNAEAKKLKGNTVYLGGAFGSSVLATANVMMAATLAKGKTIIENAACEPEVVDLGNFLIKMGADIKGLGSNIIEIEGVASLGGARHRVMFDRIEAGTYMVAAAITGGEILLKETCLYQMGAVIDKLREAGVYIKKEEDGIYVKGSMRRPVALEITTLPFPGFPTDLQAQFAAFLSLGKGISIVREKIYPKRFMHISELNRMGARIKLEGDSAIIEGIDALSGASVMASDLRASAALVLAGLVAKGKTEINRIYHLERGYENIEEKLLKLGAKIWREKV
ncbi:MAG: UDP-N-acetylglucosamine 1-carboxyvinyltransferase [Candidatus Omnitrophota bacterium]